MNNPPSEIIFTPEHVWLLPLDNGEYKLGISEYAQEQLGDIVFVEPPKLNATTHAGEACAVVESVKSASDIICPVDGEVSAVNPELEDAPELINESPYDKGWIAYIKTSAETEITGKMNVDQYNEFVSTNAN